MEKMANAIRVYMLADSLKDKIRSGEIIWHVSKERLESVAEHIYSTCILAIVLDSEYDFNINIDRVVKMIVIHELEEVSIGDLTPFDNISKQEKNRIGENSVRLLLKGLVKADEYMELTEEYNKKETNDAQYASYCDKAQSMIEMKKNDELGYSDMYSEENADLLKEKWIKKLIDNGSKSVSDLFNDFHRSSFNGNPVFEQLADYIKNNNITECITQKKLLRNNESQ